MHIMMSNRNYYNISNLFSSVFYFSNYFFSRTELFGTRTLKMADLGDLLILLQSYPHVKTHIFDPVVVHCLGHTISTFSLDQSTGERQQDELHKFQSSTH